MNDNEFDAFRRGALQDLAIKEEILTVNYDFDSISRYECNCTQEPAATLTFFDKSDKPALICEVIEIGTFSVRDGSWKWAWCNDSLPPKLQERALPLRQLQQITGKDYFGFADPFPADKDMALTLTAFAVQHLSALGYYSALINDGRLRVFLVYVNIKALGGDGHGMADKSEVSKVDELMKRAHRWADLAGNAQVAAELQSEAWKKARALLAGRPEDPMLIQKAGSVLYSWASFLSSAGRSKEAITALDECEQHYSRLRGIIPEVDGWMADVTMARAVAEALSGAGSSAVIDGQSAVTGYRNLLNSGRSAARFDFARVLSTSADILAAFGDPDLARAAADAAASIYLQKEEQVTGDQVHIQYLLRALAISLKVAEAQGRDQVAKEINGMLGRLRELNRTGRTSEMLVNHDLALNSDCLGVTCASALDTAGHVLGHSRVTDLLRNLFGLAEPHPAMIPLDRAMIDPAFFARQVAELGVDLLPLEPTAGLRLCLEGHYLFAGASRLQILTMRYQLAEYGTPWARALLASARHLESSGRLTLALDLASWAEGLAGQLIFFTAIDSGFRTLVRDCVTQHGRLLVACGHRNAGENALSRAARLSSEWGLDS